MAVLGTHGRLLLRRTAPPPETINTANINKAQNVYTLTTKGYRSGDLVEIASTTNWPNSSTTAPKLVPAYIADIPPAYRDKLELVDYTQPYPTGLDSNSYKNQLYIHVDTDNRLSFYRDRRHALLNNVSNRESMSTIAASDVLQIRLVNDWRVECGLSDWSLEMSADVLETSGVTKSHFEGYKSKLSGGGELSFLLKREFYDPKNATIISYPAYQNAVVWTNEHDEPTYLDADIELGISSSSAYYNNSAVTGASEVPELYSLMARSGTSNLLRLLLQLNDEAPVEAEFWLIAAEAGATCNNTPVLEPGDLYYRASVLIDRTAITVASGELVAGTASFVTVGEVDLLEGL